MLSSVVAPGGLDGQSVELQELQGVFLAIVAQREVRLELDRPDDATKAAGERNRRAVGDHAVGEGGTEVAPRGGDVLAARLWRFCPRSMLTRASSGARCMIWQSCGDEACDEIGRAHV